MEEEVEARRECANFDAPRRKKNAAHHKVGESVEGVP
jgi:hypothetical protein